MGRSDQAREPAGQRTGGQFASEGRGGSSRGSKARKVAAQHKAAKAREPIHLQCDADHCRQRFTASNPAEMHEIATRHRREHLEGKHGPKGEADVRPVSGPKGEVRGGYYTHG